MASLREIHDAIQVRLDTIDGLTAYGYPPQGVAFPCAFPHLQSWEANAMGKSGSIVLDFEVVVLTAETVRPQDGYRRLLEFVDHEGASSIFGALWDGNDRAAGTFGGLSSTQLDMSAPGAFRVLGVEEMDAYQAYGGSVAVRVVTKG